jgi:ketosteroid isomerase-like protein
VITADRIELSALVHGYAAGVDDRDIDAVVELLSPDAELVLPNPPDVLTPVQAHRGANAIRAALDAVTTVGRTHHSIDSEVYRRSAEHDVAHGRIGGTAHHWSRHHDTITDVVWYLRYDDDYVHTDSGWLITRRALTIDAIETRPARRMR